MEWAGEKLARDAHSIVTLAIKSDSSLMAVRFAKDLMGTGEI
jgi:hypothetical protein